MNQMNLWEERTNQQDNINITTLPTCRASVEPVLSQNLPRVGFLLGSLRARGDKSRHLMVWLCFNI